MESSIININIPGYRIVRTLGVGGMATVYLAIQESFEREVALKVMSKALTENSDFTERFLREARIVSSLVHPHIVTVYDVGVHDGHHYLSMEYIPGRDVKDSMGELSGAQIISIIQDVALALDYAGKKGYVHRDVKPENIMLHADGGRAVLMDFGIARAANGVNSMTQTGIALGTPHYMSPEQARGQSVDVRSDLYSLGVVFYLLLTGGVPFDADTAVAVGIKHISEPVPKLPRELAVYQSLIDKMLHKKPDSRFQSGEDLVAALAKLNPKAIDQWHAGSTFRLANARLQTAIRKTTDSTTAIKRQMKKHHTQDRAKSSLRVATEDIDTRQMTPRRSLFWPLLLLVVVVASGGAYVYVDRFGMPAELEPWLEKTSAALKIPPQWLAWLPQSGQQSDVDEGLPAAQQPSRLAKLESLLAEAKQLEDAAEQDPQQLARLIDLYQQIRRDYPSESSAVQALSTLRERQLSSLDQLTRDSQWQQASQTLQQSLQWFPELADDRRFQALQRRVSDYGQVDQLLTQAAEYLERNRLLLPAGDNAKETYDRVLAIDPGNRAARDGIKKVAARYLTLAEQARKGGDLGRALALVNSGLRVNANSKGLLALRDTLRQQMGTREQIEQLLSNARSAEAEQRWFDQQDGAIATYQSVLALEGRQMNATAGLMRVHDGIKDKAQALADQGQFDEAVALLQQAVSQLSDHQALQELIAKINASRPGVDQLIVSGNPIAEGDQLRRSISAERTLYISFAYHNLPQKKSVFQVILLDGARSVQIAAVPVIVTGANGTSRFRIDRPVEGFADGGYHIDIVLSDRVVATESFSIIR